MEGPHPDKFRFIVLQRVKHTPKKKKKKNAPTYEKPGILLLPDVPNQFCAVRQELRGQKMSKYFMFVSFPPYGTLTVVCHAFL